MSLGLRFRRYVRLAPGLRLNFSGSGMSLTAGPRGASVNFGSRGTYLNAGIPGTGLYSRTRLDSPSSHVAASVSEGPQKVLVNVEITLDDEGKLKLDYNRAPAPEYLITKAKREHGDEIREVIEGVCEKVNGQAKALASIHTQTPPPTARVVYKRRDFDESSPKAPLPKSHGVLGWVFKGVAAKIDAANQSAQEKYKSDLAAWSHRKSAFEAEEAERQEFLEHLVFTDPAAMEKHFAQGLQDIDWPRETHVSFEILEAGRGINVDVDLPEVEDMPKKSWNLPAHSFKPTIKQISESQLLKLYADHVQGVGFRIMGEAFAILPSIQTVTLSAYTQRPNPAMGAMQDEYVYSVRASRDVWSRINFNNLGALDVTEALAQFELRRDMGKNGVMKAIEPLVSMEHAGQRQVVDVVSRGVATPPGLAISSNGAMHDRRASPRELVVPETESLHHSGPEAFEDNVGAIEEL